MCQMNEKCFGMSKHWGTKACLQFATHKVQKQPSKRTLSRKSFVK